MLSNPDICSMWKTLIFKKNGVTVHAKACRTIPSRLVTPKDTTDKLDKSGAISYIECRDCDRQSYLEKTEKKLKRGLGEQGRESSPVTNIRKMVFPTVTILDRQAQWQHRCCKAFPQWRSTATSTAGSLQWSYSVTCPDFILWSCALNTPLTSLLLKKTYQSASECYFNTMSDKV